MMDLQCHIYIRTHVLSVCVLLARCLPESYRQTVTPDRLRLATAEKQILKLNEETKTNGSSVCLNTINIHFISIVYCLNLNLIKFTNAHQIQQEPNQIRNMN